MSMVGPVPSASAYCDIFSRKTVSLFLWQLFGCSLQECAQALGCGRGHTRLLRLGLLLLLLLLQALSNGVSSGGHSGVLEQAQYEYAPEPRVGRHLQANMMAQYILRSNTSQLPALAAIDAGCGRIIAIWAASKEPSDNLSAYDLYLQARLAVSFAPALLKHI